MAKNHVGLQLGTAKVEHPMLEPKLLGGELLPFLAGDRNGGRDRGTDDFQLPDTNFDLARAECRITGCLRAEGHLARDQDNIFRAEGGRVGHDLSRGPIRAERKLDDSGAIP